MKHRFGGFVLDVGAGRLLGPGGEIRLRPYPFKLLLALAEHAPRILSQDELLDLVWGVEHLSTTSVKQAVSVVRRALGDDPARPTVIETVPRRGYRFIAPLARIEEETPPPVARTPVAVHRGPRSLALTLAIRLAVVAFSAFSLLIGATPDHGAANTASLREPEV